MNSLQSRVRATPSDGVTGLPPERRRRGLLELALAIFFPLAALASLALAVILKQIRDDDIAQWTERTHSAAEIRRDALDDWIGERIADVDLFANFPSIREYSAGQRPDVASRPSGLGVHIAAIVEPFRRDHPEFELTLVLPSRVESLTDPESTPDAAELAVAELARAAGATQVDLVRTRAGRVSFVAAAPVPSTDPGAPPSGALLLSTDPDLYLFPRLLRPPFASSTSETTLGRREGDHIRFLGPLRHLPAPALTFESTEAMATLPIQFALAGKANPPEGRDYRGEPVIAAALPLRHVPWGLVVKIDRSEALAGYFVERNAIVAAGTSTVLALVAAALLLVSRTQRNAAAESARQEQLSRKRLERERLLLGVVYSLDEAIVHEADRERLFAACCRILVEEAGYRVAEILRADDRLGEFRLAAYHGPIEPVVDRLGLRFDASPSGDFATGVAFRSGKTIVCGDLTTDPAVELFRQVMLDRGHRAAIFLPLFVETTPWGELVILDCEPRAFSQRTVDLLERAAASLSHALTLIVERERREAAERNREHLVAAIEQADEAVVITDAAGDIEFVNPAFEQVTGYLREEVLGKNPRILKSGAQDSRFYEDLWSTLAQGSTWRGRMVNRRKDGTTFEEQATISPVRDAGGAVSHYVAVKRDVSREAQLERELARAQKLEAIGRMAGGIAHDYNNMLAVVLGYSEILESILPPGHEGRPALQEIRTATERATALTQQLLHFGRNMPSHATRFDLNEALRKLLRLLRPLLGEDIEIDLHLAPQLLEIHVDAAQLDQVVVNLAVNARDAMPRGGRLTIETLLVAPEESAAAADEAAQWARLTVSDDGAGMDESTLQHLFEPFFTTKQPGKGTGLGLSTVYAHVQHWGARLAVDSAPGAGTRFRIELPLATSSETAVAASAEGSVQVPAATVLLVEDQDELRHYLQQALAQLGLTVLAARDGEDALALLARDGRAFDLLISDLVMPRMGGPELARKLAEVRPGLRVLFISGYPPDRFDPDATGAWAPLLQKPFTRKALARAVTLSLTGPRFGLRPRNQARPVEPTRPPAE
jgi:PAS domain S-box-containing protein